MPKNISAFIAVVVVGIANPSPEGLEGIGNKRKAKTPRKGKSQKGAPRARSTATNKIGEVSEYLAP